MPALAATAWLAVGLAGTGARGYLIGAIVAGAAYAAVRWARGRGGYLAAALVLTAGSAAGSAVLSQAAVEHNPVHRLARSGASVTAVVRLTTDPVLSRGRFVDQVRVEGVVREVSSRGQRFAVTAPVLLILRPGSRSIQRGSLVHVSGTLRPSPRLERSAILVARTEVLLLRAPAGLTAAGNRMRAAVRDAVAGQPAGPRALVPALVDGQDGDLAASLVEDFRTTGMTHLLAVSGTNLTLILGFLLILARWLGFRSYALTLVGLLGVGGFLVLAGTEPSVLRAAAMGVIALAGLGNGGRQRGIRALGLGVLILLLADPWLARSIGFALSVGATAAILLLVPRWRTALSHWMPRWCAEAIAVPLAAQIACTPLVAMISGQISIVAVAANLLAAPLVAPATVCGLGAGAVALFWESGGRVVAAPAGWAAAGLIGIAERAARVPVPAISWSLAPGALLLLTGVCAVLLGVLHHLLIRRWATSGAAGTLALIMAVPLPTPGWPPPGWVFTVCDVGQGDGLVLRAGPGAAVVVDAGPDPTLIDGCLRRLGVRSIPMVVLTHFHADHVDGLSGVLKGRRVGEIVTSPLPEPAAGAEEVRRIAERYRVPLRSARFGELVRYGGLSWQILAPDRIDYPESDSPPNDASVVMLVEVSGLRLLLMGDQERPSQTALRRQFPDLHADVLKVAHHGSSKQDVDLVEGLGARVGLISVGADNGYGHPAATTVTLLERAGLQVHRTDQEGDLAVVVTRAGLLATVVSGSSPRHGAAAQMPVRGP